MLDQEKLVPYYNSKDEDVALGRALVEKLLSMGTQLCNIEKNAIIKEVQQIYSSGSYRGQKRVVDMINKVAQNHNEVLPKAVSEYLAEYATGYFEDSEAFERNKARISKDRYYLGIAEAVLVRSTCLRRRYGAVIVKNDQIVATGYNGAPRSEDNCIDKGYCEREANKIPKGERYEMCLAVHAEQNAIISASRSELLNGTIYIVGREVKDWEYANPEPCLICRRMIKNAGISRIVGLYKGEVIEY